MKDETLTLEKLKIAERLASLEKESKIYHDYSKEWRGGLDTKIGKIFDRLDTLPCDIHSQKHEENSSIHNYLWAVITIIFGALGFLFKKVFNI